MRRTKDHDGRRAELRHAAARAIAARGTTGVSLREVAQEADMSPSSILYYYRDLDELVAEAIQYAIERFSERRHEAAESYGDPEERLVATIVRGFPTSADDLDVLLLYLGVPVIRSNTAIAALTRSLTARQRALYRSILEVGAARGSFTLNDDSATIAANLVALEDAYGLYVMNDNAERLPRYIAYTVSYAETSTACDLMTIATAMLGWDDASTSDRDVSTTA